MTRSASPLMTTRWAVLILLGPLACSPDVLVEGATGGGTPSETTTSGGGDDGAATGSGGGDSAASAGGAGGEPVAGSGGAPAGTPCGLDLVEYEPLRECLCHNCCEEAKACTKAGEDPDGCIACLESGGGERCDALLACESEACCTCAFVPMVCDSGFITANRAVDLDCLGQACCDAFTACAEGEADADACRACIDAGGGPRCDAALACALEACGHVASELGTCRRR